MTGFFELVFFMIGMVLVVGLFMRVCQEGDYDDYD